MKNEQYGKEYTQSVLKRIKRVLLIFIILLFLGLFIGSVIGGSNPLLVVWPPTWVHFFSFLH